MFLCAAAVSHDLLLVVKLIVTGLFAAYHPGQAEFLTSTKM